MELYSKFESLTEEKKNRIIEACIDEFSRNGYTNASTNTIVKNAGISKGMLFHYFGNKKSLYLYLVDYITDFMIGLYHQWMTDVPSDFFERLAQIGMMKLKTASVYPTFYKFMIDSYIHVPDELKNDIQQRQNRTMKDNWPLLYKDIDTSGIREDIDKRKAVELIMLALDALSGKYLKTLENMDSDAVMSSMERVYAEYCEYINILKKVMYT